MKKKDLVFLAVVVLGFSSPMDLLFSQTSSSGGWISLSNSQISTKQDSVEKFNRSFDNPTNITSLSLSTKNASQTEANPKFSLSRVNFTNATRPPKIDVNFSDQTQKASTKHRFSGMRSGQNISLKPKANEKSARIASNRISGSKAFGKVSRPPVPHPIPELVDPEMFKVAKQEKRDAKSEAKKKNPNGDDDAVVSAKRRRVDNQNSLVDKLSTPSLERRAMSIQRAVLNQRVMNHVHQFQNSAGYDVGQPATYVVTTKTRVSPNFAHNPLYFEDANLERYGIGRGRTQPISSGIHFFKSLATLPYQTAVRHPKDCVYSLGYFRSGSCNPAFANRTGITNKRGLLRQSLIIGALAAGL